MIGRGRRRGKRRRRNARAGGGGRRVGMRRRRGLGRRPGLTLHTRSVKVKTPPAAASSSFLQRCVRGGRGRGRGRLSAPL